MDIPKVGPIFGWEAGVMWKGYETFAQVRAETTDTDPLSALAVGRLPPRVLHCKALHDIGPAQLCALPAHKWQLCGVCSQDLCASCSADQCAQPAAGGKRLVSVAALGSGAWWWWTLGPTVVQLLTKLLAGA
jgi:hypothetical protein